MTAVLVPIVEGQSEERSIGPLLRRMLLDLGVYDVDIARPFRVKRGRVVRPGELERSVTQEIRSRVGASAVLVLLDADDDCPATLGPELLTRVAAHAVPVRVVIPKVRPRRGFSPRSNPFAVRGALETMPSVLQIQSQCVMRRGRSPG